MTSRSHLMIRTLRSAILGSVVALIGSVAGVRADGGPPGSLRLPGWSPLNPLPEPRSAAPLVACGSKLYMFGGSTATSPQTRSVLAYDTAANSWTQLPDYPGPPIRSAPAICLNGYIYLLGGYLYDYAISDQLWRFDPASATWEQRTSIPEARLHASVQEVSGRIYVVGGRTTPAWQYRSTTLVYDPSLDTHPPSSAAWSEASSVALDTPLGDNAGISLNGDMFTLGSYEPSVPGRFLCYSPRLDRYAVLPMAPMTAGCVVTRAGNQLWALQGSSLWSWEYSAATSPGHSLHLVGQPDAIPPFVSQPSIPEPISFSGFCEHDGLLFAAAATLNGNYSDHVWVFAP